MGGPPEPFPTWPPSDPVIPVVAHAERLANGADPEWLAAMEPLPVPPPSAAPHLPGRHAGRVRSRGDLGATGLLSGLRVAVRWLPGAGLRFSAVHAAVISLVVAVGLIAGAWWLFRSAPEEVTLVGELTSSRSAEAVPDLSATVEPGHAESSMSGDAGASSGGARNASWSGAGAGEVVVDVAGKVRRPGIAVLPQGARVIDALKAAGGARRGVDLTSLNLARVLVDGEQILVGVPGVPGVAAESAQTGAAGTGPLVNLNTADQAALEELPGVGPVTAAAIISWREQHQGFGAVEELVEVDGIGEATLARLAPLVTL